MRPNFLVGSLADIVSSYQIWFQSIHFCRRYGGKPLPEEAGVITMAWRIRLANNTERQHVVMMSLPTQ